MSQNEAILIENQSKENVLLNSNSFLSKNLNINIFIFNEIHRLNQVSKKIKISLSG